jgi:hypothetical protein
MSQPLRNYKEVFEDFAKDVEENFRHDAYVVPFLFIEDRKGELIAVDATKGWEDKDNFTHWVQRLLKKVKARMMVTISEAWMRKLKGEEQGQPYRGPVSKDPNREEVVILTFETFGAQFVKIWRIWEVMGMRVLIDLHEIPEGLTFQVRFSGNYFNRR